MSAERSNEHEWIRMHTAEQVVERLVKSDFPHLTDAHIWCLGRPTATRSRGRWVLAKASSPSPALKAVAEDGGGNIDYVIVVARDVWEERLTPPQREALIYHELCHFAGHDHEAGRWELAGHDAEMFAAEVEKYGAWRDDLRAFFRRVKAAQMDLFAADEQGVSVS